MKRLSNIKESVWSDIQDRSTGEQIRKEDEIDALNMDDLYDYIEDHYEKTKYNHAEILKGLTPENEYLMVPAFGFGAIFFRFGATFKENKIASITIHAGEYSCKEFLKYLKKRYLTTYSRNGGIDVKSQDGQVSNTIFLDVFDTILEKSSLPMFKKKENN